MEATPRLFPPTSMTLIERMHSPDPQERELCMERFCAVYYPAVYGLARVLNLSVEDAQDRTQEFFIRMITRGLFEQFDRERGFRFSAWLAQSFRNSAITHHTRRTSLKRGGAYEFIEFDPDAAEHSYQSLQHAQLEPGVMMDLMLARGIWPHAVKRLREKHEGKATSALVGDLIPFALCAKWPTPPAPTQEELARRHGTTPTLLRAFFSRAVRTKLAQLFAEEALAHNPGIDEQEIDQLWELMRIHAGA